ncbi:ATP-binding protein [Streptomyces griseoincarnatus]|uniref:histidine kinase n=1 Tax=Streptomyces griseoincarnatus TaxID=29305 RepID=A0ABT0VWA5_STRGI|nr:ATP-binding protein [Streptomyces griseoincarnatus]MCM2514178.1 ATP-binding protein [Streptomyces griseoincarnatus]
MTSPLLPGDRPTPRSLLPAPVLTAAFCAVAVVAAFFLVPDAAIGAVLVTGVVASVLLCAAVTAAAYARLTARSARERLEAVTQDVGRLLQERSRLTEDARRQHELLTGELTRERARLSAELDQERAHLAEALAGERDRLAEQHAAELARLAHERAEERTRADDAHTAELARSAERHTAELDRLTAQHTDELAKLTGEHTEERERLEEERDRLARERIRLAGENARLTTRLREAEGARSAALAATANAAGRMQALATGMLADLRAMEEKHHDEEVLADLLHLDHRTAQAGRLADSVAVLTGARSGRRWARPIPMESILRGAMGRIAGYQRVRVHSASDTSVAGHAAEGVMHALAELLDNAANFSPPTAEVHVYVEEVPAGVIVSVEDSGLVMGEAQLRRAERAVSGESTELGGLTGTRLGLAVVGRLARRYGLRVSYRPSARGGTGVLVLLPQDLLVPADAAPLRPVTAPATNGTPARTLTTAVKAAVEKDRTPSAGEAAEPSDAPKAEPAAHTDAEPSAPTDAEASDTRDRTLSATNASKPSHAPKAEPATPTDAEPSAPTDAEPSDTRDRTPSATKTTEPPGTPDRTPSGARGAEPAGAQGDLPSAAEDAPLVLPRRRSVTGRGAEPEPRHGATGDTLSPASTETERPASPAAVLPAPSYAAARSGGDVDADPVPAHAAASGDGDAPPLVLPRRRRGRTLAEAERRAGGGSRAAESRPAPTAEETRDRVARFSSFRQAVRTSTPDDAADPDAGVTPARDTTPDPETAAQPTPVTSEGDTTS